LRQLASTPLADGRSHPALPVNLRTKKCPVLRVDAAIHNAVTVGGRYDAMLRDSQKVPLLDRNLWERPERFCPRIDQESVEVNEVQAHINIPTTDSGGC